MSRQRKEINGNRAFANAAKIATQAVSSKYFLIINALYAGV